jgi:ribokinase
VALITVSEQGENTIVVVPGANSLIDAKTAAERIARSATSDTVLLAQLEIPLDVVKAGAEAVAAADGRFVLNLSPSREVPAGLLALADPLVVNESEASMLAGVPVDSADQALSAAAVLAQTCRSVVVTLGGDGVVLADDFGVRHFPAERVPVVDTTGAGDAFVGALVAVLAAGEALEPAVQAGIAAGAAAVQYVGAQPPRT